MTNFLMNVFPAFKGANLDIFICFYCSWCFARVAAVKVSPYIFLVQITYGPSKLVGIFREIKNKCYIENHILDSNLLF